MVKVMLVEDDPIMIDLLRTLLQLEGFDVCSISPGDDILATIQENDPNVILLDVHLLDGKGTEINGFDLLDQIRDDDQLKNCKVVMSSGLDFKEKSKQAGADGFILKPYMPDALIDLIKVVNE